MDNCNKEIDLLFETSWEVCNKIGGIYTVLSTKAATLQSMYKDKVIFIGPDVWTEDNPSPYFTESKTLLRKWAGQALLPQGVDVRIGRWDIPGKPIAILVKFNGMYAVKDEFYGRMWQLYGVDSLHAYGDYDEGCAFAHAAGIVIESLTHFFSKQKTSGNKPLSAIAHFDEWTTGMGLLYVKAALPQVATVFTTHATSIGRSICGNGKPLYDYLQGYDGDQMARELNMESKHSLEKAAALQADCFTTVSEVTARECEQLLGRRPDVVTPNGFEKGFVPKGGRLNTARKAARGRMLEVASALTGVSYSDDTFIVATSGRCEYRNKGIDLYLDAMDLLGNLDPERKVLAFVMVPAWSGQPRPDLVNQLGLGNKQRLGDPYCTHTLHNYDSDPIIQRIHGLGFANDGNSRITVIYVPCYLNGTDGVFDMSYYQLLPGFDATVFPSYYEPWGYTPLESVAFGVPTVTTSLSGFGQWVLDSFENSFEACGVRVESRGDSNYSQVCHEIAGDIRSLISDSADERTRIMKAAMNTAEAASWANFIKDYEKAYCIALEAAARRVGVQKATDTPAPKKRGRKPKKS
ncbi:MAG: glycogen/starch synthase [Muribaculaceae bacterium]|nr:glycogen/starch synthase [Muribaculaceae bacterium]